MYTFLKKRVYINEEENIMKTSDKLKKLFDYQEFEKDSDLIHMKADAENCGNILLTDEELAMASGGSPNGVMPIIFGQELLGLNVAVIAPSGTTRGNIVDVEGTKVLVDTVGWVDIMDTDLCQQK